MPILAENFRANALSGTVLVTDGYANLALATNPYVLEGNKSFIIKIRKGGIDGQVVATSPTITLLDNSQFVSLTANVSTVAEGNLVSFTLVTANAADNANVYYSILPVTSNVNTQDFVGANVGKATIFNNQAIFSYFANADYSIVDETGETFKVQLRTNSVTGNIVYTTSNVAITDFYKRINVFRFEESSSSIVEGSTVTFTVYAHNTTAGSLLYYYTSGNADISGSNTGSIAMNGVSNTITITTASTVPSNESRTFNLKLAASNLGTPIATSNSIAVVDSALAYLNATGGTVSLINGYKLHTFTSSGTFAITNLNTASLKSLDILSVAGGGGGGRGNGTEGGGGGGGGFISQTGVTADANLAIVIGAGGAGYASNAVNSGNPTTVIGGSTSITSIGGGGGGGGGGYGGVANPGGSGGGGNGSAPPGGNAGAGTPGQGFPGGTGLADFGGGGGGASQAGDTPTGKGGDGAPSLITGANVIYAGGGGASVNGLGGAGGGGTGAPGNTPYAPSGGAGTVNRGGGGGGGVPATAGPGGNGGSGVVIIRYAYIPPAFYTSVTANSSVVVEGSNAFFVVNTTFANASTLFYDTIGNVTSSNFVNGNTGSFTVTSNATVLRLQTVGNVPAGETRNFALRIREDSLTGNIALISSNVTIIDENSPLRYANITGGNVEVTGGYKIHTFTVSGNLNVISFGADPVEYLAVAGGGAGGGWPGGYGGQHGGGGGGGGLLVGTLPVVNAGNVTIVVGAGGSPLGGQGGNTIISGLTAVGGGGGYSISPFTNYKNGGSGGGGGSGGYDPSPAGGLGYTGQGNPGGAGDGFTGGGGGYTTAGTNGSPGGAGPGGYGYRSTISGANVGYAGGGGGSGGVSPLAFVGVGRDGGGRGFPSGGGAPEVSGNVNSGGGGGGGGTAAGSGTGGSGVVIIRYPFA